MATKLAAGALDYAGADMAGTGLTQVWTGRQQKTFTNRVVQGSLRSLGVNAEIAGRLGDNTEIAMNIAAAIGAPLSAARALGAARVVRVEKGLIDLEVEEGFPGAHTIGKHVGQSLPALQTRLAAYPRLPAASTFRTLWEAEYAVTKAILAYAQDIQALGGFSQSG